MLVIGFLIGFLTIYQVSYIIEEYRCGRTPNPDVLCNTRIKFGKLLSAIVCDQEFSPMKKDFCFQLKCIC